MIKSKNISLIYNFLALILGGGFGCIFNVTGHTGVVDIFLAPFGSLYLRVLQFVALPMIFCLVVVSITSFPDLRKIISLSLKSVFANVISSVGVGVISCGVTLFFVAKNYLSLASSTVSRIQGFVMSDYMDKMMNIVQSNVSGRFMQQHLIRIFVAAVLLGLIISTTRKKLYYLGNLFSSLHLVLTQMIGIIMRFTPFGVFAITADVFASNDLSMLESLLGLISLAFVISVLSTLLSIFLVSRLIRKSFLVCLKVQAHAIFFGFATAASTACIPLTQEAAEKLGCDEETSAFVIPLTKMLMKPGGLLDTYCCLAFVLVVSGQVVSLGMWCYMILISIIFSLAAPAVPLGGVFIIPTALSFFGYEAPEHLLGVLCAVYLFLDMIGTGMTCSLDILSAVVVEKIELHGKKLAG